MNTNEKLIKDLNEGKRPNGVNFSDQETTREDLNWTFWIILIMIFVALLINAR